MRSESTRAFGQPRETKEMRGALAEMSFEVLLVMGVALARLASERNSRAFTHLVKYRSVNVKWESFETTRQAAATQE